MSSIIQSLEQEQLKRRPRFAAGDRLRVHFQVIEGNRTRTQVFEGVVIKRQGSGVRETFTVRKQSFGVGVERTFPLHSPKIEKLEIAARGAVRRAKLYYLRDRVGKAARVAERRWGISDDMLDDADGAVDASGTAQVDAPQAVPAPAGAAASEVDEGEPDLVEVEAAPDETADAGEAAEPGDPELVADADADAKSDDEPAAEAAEDAADDSGDGESGAGEPEADSDEDDASARDA